MIRTGFDNRAQTSLDFLFGIIIFIFAFLFVFAFIPGMFAPFQSNSDELTMTSDRVAATLVSDLLAVNNTSTKLPGIIDKAKLDQFQTEMGSANNMTLRGALGLNNTGNKDIMFNLQVIVSMKGIDTPLSISHGEKTGMGNVGQSRRFVIIRDINGADIDRYPGRIAILTVRVW